MAARRNRYDAVKMEARPWYRPKLTPNQKTGAWISSGVLATLFIAWFGITWPVRGELGKVEHYLESLPELEDVHLSIPLFSASMPDQVELTATGLPKGYSYEVRVELKGTYDTRSRQASVIGVKQVLMPYEKVKVDWRRDVPRF